LALNRLLTHNGVLSAIACYGSERKRLFSTVILNGGIIGARRCMTREKKTGWRRSVLRIGTAMQAILYAVLVTGIVWRFNPTLPYGALVLIFVGFCIAFYFLWIWVFVERPAELAKKLPISSKELRRKRQEFYDNLPNDCPHVGVQSEDCSE